MSGLGQHETLRGFKLCLEPERFLDTESEVTIGHDDYRSVPSTAGKEQIGLLHRLD